MYHLHKQAIHQWILALFIIALNLVLFGQVATSDVLSAIGVSALAATTFIAIILPNSPVAKPRCLFFSYVIALSMGAICSTLFHMDILHHIAVNPLIWETAFGVLAVGMTMLAMLLFRVPHPPAAGLALGLVLDDWAYPTVFAIFAAVSVIALIKWALRARLKDLV